MRKFMRKGFTLAEVLLVIAIIGVLSGMMMVASSESVKTTEANNIVNNLRNFASAAMTFYTDSMDHFTATPNDTSTDLKSCVVKYMYNGGNSIQNSGDYYVKNDNGKWWVGYALPDANNDGIKTRLKAKAQSSNLRGSEGIGTFPATDSTSYYDGQQSAVWLRIR